ncbi:MAG TPA: SPOR domain-containing protein [Blastocatellia bacterium]|nr:SPOR domain-containing protein [Blastocatellia bacterium]
MHARRFLLLTVLLIAASSSVAFSKAETNASLFALQVGSFPDPDLANRFIVQLVKAGEHPLSATVKLEGRGHWTRVFVGLFNTTDAAWRYGATLVTRGIIQEFLIRKADSTQAFTRPRRVSDSDSPVPRVTGNSGLKSQAPVPTEQTAFRASDYSRPASGLHSAMVSADNGAALFPKDLRDPLSTDLPIVQGPAFLLAPRVDTSLIPRPDPVSLAFRLVAGEVRNVSSAPGQRGGLWISGDTAEGLERLRWIVGEENVELIKLDADGRVKLDKRLLAKAAGLREARVEDPLRAVDYISSNEGLLLLVEVTQGRYRYLLHMGRQAPTSGRSAETFGSINLDNNVDSRINPYRKNGRKLDAERPPQGFDSLIGLNPIARWFNLSTNCWVQSGQIVFHEIAEAYAKLELGLDYLDHGLRSGAHAIALERELRLKSQRPGADIVMTAGSNRLLRTEAEIRLFYAEAAAGVSQR